MCAHVCGPTYLCPCTPCLCVPACLLCVYAWPCTSALCPGLAHLGLQGIVGRGPAWRPLQRPEPAFWGGAGLTRGPSPQLEQAVRRESGEPAAQEPRELALQSVELRRQLQEEQASYRRKLQAYQEGQQRQAQLVQRLQAKVGPPPRPRAPFLPQPQAPRLTRSPPTPRFSSARRRARRRSSSCWRDAQSWSSCGCGWAPGGAGLTLPALPSLTPLLPYPSGRRAQPGPGERPHPPGGGAAEVGPRGARGGRPPSAQAPTCSPLPRPGAPAWPR